MVPKNKRKLTSIIDSLFLFISANEGIVWKGDRTIQRKFEEMLEKTEIKSPGQPYDPNSGGARTYEAQLSSLGLIFLDSSGTNTAFRPTLAGQGILDGENPLPILQNQLLKFQYPSAYSIRRNVNISPDFIIRPFLFILKLLRDSDIKYLSKKEVGRFVIVYGKNERDYDSVKKMIIEYRKNDERDFLLRTFMEDSISPRTKNHNFKQRIIYLEDKANIFFNYMESSQLIIRPEGRDKIEINADALDIIESFEKKNPPFIRNPDRQDAFQRRYGLSPTYTKDTRRFNVGQISDKTLKERFVMREFFSIASTNIIMDINNPEIISELSSSTGISEHDVERILGNKRPEGLNYFEEKYIDMAMKGRDNATEFEMATCEIFSKMLGFYSEHIGQRKPKDRTGGNPDGIIVSKEAKYCAILDAKAYSHYSITNDHANRMIHNYIPNYKENVESGEPLKFFLYVSGGFSNTFGIQVKNIARISKVNGSGISAKNLICMARKRKSKGINHTELADIFTKNKEITSMDI